MKLIADEGVERQIVQQLRETGHEVFYAAESSPGVSDEWLLGSALGAEALLLTNDKDFGELVYRQKRLTHGVVLLRLAGLPNSSKAKLVCTSVAKHGGEMLGSFTVISPGSVRVRRSSR